MTEQERELIEAAVEWSRGTHCGDHDTEECDVCARLRAAVEKYEQSATTD